MESSTLSSLLVESLVESQSEDDERKITDAPSQPLDPVSAREIEESPEKWLSVLDTEELSLDCVGEFIVSNDGVMVCSRDSWCEGVDANEQ
jgi:hypothetical protein